ncbi:Trypsin-like peptidase domain-containing protein [Dyella jiangningensis]|uniref:AVAST type 1 anti-phage system protease Avs1b n=1 Tax=Dyella sp. AtDHG13 TaxID=1938897 RepID=UPI00087F9779|nr:AVAST type 1 anti-phage system protease Avs1b [Dyella sp. AtDHG13]PXV52350.1 trypsin-like peptidase [Dyella sp. AtDHG13]SDL38215.1 Trypsin-like peptidase domain-containing protein [Dyella jiangningensis]
MIEEEVKDASCQIVSDVGSGTGWLISSELVITALHCVRDSSGRIVDTATLTFSGTDAAATVEAAVVGSDDALDVCLLKLPGPSGRRPVPLATAGTRAGEKWFAFGYPVVKLQLGHVAQGVVQQVLEAPLHGIDMDLVVDASVALSDYEGLSGAALMVDDVCQGLIRVRVDNGLGAISCSSIREFLLAHGLSPDTPAPVITAMMIGTRPQFDALLVDGLRESKSGYLLLEGAHGIGKSTYCQTFAPDADDVEVLGVYAFTDRARGYTSAHQAQPEIFYDWLNTLRSTRSTGRPARLSEMSYSQLIEHTHRALQALARGCAESGKDGVLFIDGVNEAVKAGAEALQRFMGLLPQTLPPGLKIIMTGVGLESLSAKLGDVALGAKRLTLPVLGRQAQVDICLSVLDGKRATPALVNLLCDRALGHPLYLRYLLDLVNGGTSDDELEKLPAFSGVIEDFYETVWAQLLSDSDAINLLGMIARLRWGVPTAALMPLLTPGESAAYIPTLARIRHLLSTPETTEIYHPSFSEFVIHKTAEASAWVHGRLAAFCADDASGKYGVLNRVYHGLLGDHARRVDAMTVCSQSWVDASVLLEADPDLLLSDIDDALTAATREGSAVDIVRLLLLSGRLTFRYNMLFAQSAELVAQALISLGKTDHALRHALRDGRLIVGPEEAFAVAYSLISTQQHEQALTILTAVNRILAEACADDAMTIRQFIHLAELRIHVYVISELAGADTPTFELVKYVGEVLGEPRNKIPRDQQGLMMQRIVGDMLGATLCLQGRYKPVATIPMPEGVPSHAKALSLIAILNFARMYSSIYSVRLPEAPIRQLLADISDHLDETLVAEHRDFDVVDALISVGAAPELVARYAEGVTVETSDIPLFTKNRALPDDKAFDAAYAQLRAAYFLGEQMVQPVAQCPRPSDWEVRLCTLARAVAWYDGMARRAHGAGDTTALNGVREELETHLLPAFDFPLRSRIAWEESYFMPEHVVPRLYRRLAELYVDCFAGEAAGLFDLMERSFNCQLGLYNEGFRRALHSVIEPFVRGAVQGSVADRAFDLLSAWRDYVRANVENRYELVPELLHIVSLLAQAGSPEEALQTYQYVLAVSMGPGWYKEDQLSLMTDVLSALPIQTSVHASALAEIATYLERATGEMTFRRYVRSVKGTFIGELFRRGLGADGVMYFQHQACGTTQQLMEQISDGNLDRVSPFIGMRFPGGSLEEQAALLQILANMGDTHGWRIRWALLETYQHGDDRHLMDWGRQYAEIMRGLAGQPSDLAWACARIRTIACSMDGEKAWLWLQALVPALKPLMVEPLASLLNELESTFSDQQLDRWGSNFGVQRRPQVSSPRTATPALTDKTSSAPAGTTPKEVGNVAEPDDDGIRLPGTFGRRSAVREAEQAMERALAANRRRNAAAAIEHSVAALKALQQGEWSIWTDMHAAGGADQMLKDLVPDGDALARTYGCLALDERHVERWRIAARLIQLSAARISEPSQTELLRIAIEHVAHMMGHASAERFSYMGNSACAEGTPAALELLLWTLDHPTWERRDSAAAMVLWLLRTEDAWITSLTHLIVSNDRRHRADVVAASLDILSREDPVGLWRRVAPCLNIDELPDQVRHVGRFSVLLRIAERAGGQGEESADALARALTAKLDQVVTSARTDASEESPPCVPMYLDDLWYDLSELGLLDTAAVERFNAELADACAPLSIEDGYMLERGVSRSANESATSLDRWALRVRHALHVAIFPNVSLETLREADAILRIHNPESLVEPPDGRQIISRLLDALAAGTVGSYTPSTPDLVYLHMQCTTDIDGSESHIELIPQLVRSGWRGSRALAEPTFRSTEWPRPDEDDVSGVCSRVDPVPAYFGSLTPAVANPAFLKLIGADATATFRYHWRDGGRSSSRAPSRGHEHSVLALKRASLCLPPEWRLEWCLLVDGEHVARLKRY